MGVETESRKGKGTQLVYLFCTLHKN